MTNNYIQIMIESLQKKAEKLDEIMEKNKEQAELLKEADFSVELFDQNVEEKAELIAQLEMLDAGFDRTYEHVREELVSKEGKEKYKNEIKTMQQLITELTEKSVSIQAQESRNKQMVEAVFKSEREKIKAVKLGSKAAIDYYRSMNHTNFISPQFVDKKN